MEHEIDLRLYKTPEEAEEARLLADGTVEPRLVITERAGRVFEVTYRVVGPLRLPDEGETDVDLVLDALSQRGLGPGDGFELEFKPASSPDGKNY